jgi:hypothetical protein
LPERGSAAIFANVDFHNRSGLMRAANLKVALGFLACIAAGRCQAQLHAVGYINVNCPTGFTLIADPLFTSPNNDPIYSIDNTTGANNGCEIFFWQNGTWAEYIANNNPTPPATASNGWVEPNGPMLLPPGAGAAFFNPNTTAVMLTFVGTVPAGSLTNTLSPGLNLVSSILPASGDLSTNSLLTFPDLSSGQYDGDQLYLLFNSGSGGYGYTTYTVDSLNYNPPSNYGWDGLPGQPDPILNFVGQAFWYRAGNGALQWTETLILTQVVHPDMVKAKTSAAGSTMARSFDVVRSPVMLKGRHFQFELAGQTGKSHVVEASSDLKNWKPVGSNLWSSGKFIFTDPVAATNKMRFYRAFALP